MKIRLGYELIFDSPQPTPMILTLHIHYTRVSDLISPDHLLSSPPVPIVAYRDGFGNWCSRVVAPKGTIQFTASALINDPGTPDVIAADAKQHDIQSLPDETTRERYVLAPQRGTGEERSSRRPTERRER